MIKIGKVKIGKDSISYVLNVCLFTYIGVLMKNEYRQFFIGLLILGLFFSYLFLKKTFFSKYNSIKVGGSKIIFPDSITITYIVFIVNFIYWTDLDIIEKSYTVVLFITQVLPIKIHKIKK